MEIDENFVPRYDIALLKLSSPVHGQFELIDLCSRKIGGWQPLGAMGLGAISGQTFELPDTLLETVFHETYFQSTNVFNLRFCKEYNVCTETLFHGSNMCAMDQGGPLVTYYCETSVPQCLYGVTSFYLSKNGHPRDACNGGSTFTSIPYFYEWIKSTIYSNDG